MAFKKKSSPGLKKNWKRADAIHTTWRRIGVNPSHGRTGDPLFLFKPVTATPRPQVGRFVDFSCKWAIVGQKVTHGYEAISSVYHDCGRDRVIHPQTINWKFFL
jgi:hypothetical protein